MSLCIAPIADLSAADNVLMSWQCTATGRLSLALSDDPPRSAVMFIQGNPRGDIGAADRARWDAATGLTFPAAVSTHTEAALWLLTGLADPAGIDAPLPLGPTAEGRYELWMGGEAVHVFGADVAAPKYTQALAAANARQKSMQLRKIKRLVAAKDVEAVKDHVGRFGMAKLRNYLGSRPLGRGWQNKAQQLLDQWLDSEPELKRAIRAKFPSTEVTETGSSGSSVWTEVTSGLLASTWAFSAGTISQSPSASTASYNTAQRYNTPLSSDDMYVEVTIGTSTTVTQINPISRVDNAATLNGYTAQTGATGVALRLNEFNASSGAVIGNVSANPGAAGSSDTVAIYSNGTTHTATQGPTPLAGDVATDTTHQGVDHTYFAIGLCIPNGVSQIARISQVYAADLFAAASGGGRRPRAFRVGA